MWRVVKIPRVRISLRVVLKKNPLLDVMLTVRVAPKGYIGVTAVMSQLPAEIFTGPIR